MFKRFSPYIFVFLIFLIPRVIGLGGDINNYDGAYYWHPRIDDFIKEFLNGNYIKTYEHYHPGVTVMWLAGLSKYAFESMFKFVYHYDPHYLAEQFIKINFVSVFPLVFVISLLGTYQFFLIKNLRNNKVAWWFVVLLSFEPFFLGVSRFLHLTALTTMFMFASVLSILYYIKLADEKKDAFKYFLLSAIFCGLAVLTRIDGVLSGIVSIVFLMYRTAFIDEPWIKKLFLLIKQILFYVLVSFGVFVLVFPAMWVDPYGITKRIIDEGFFDTATQDAGDAPNFNFGLLFYPSFIFFRSSVFLVVVSAFSFVAFFVRYKKSFKDNLELYNWIYFGLLLIMLTAPGKMIDRYVIYFYPSLCLLCALFLSNIKSELLKKAHTIIFILQTIIILYCYYPVYSFYYSDAILGAKGFSAFGYDVKNRGEYYAQAAEYLNKKNSAADLNVVLSHREQMNTFGKFFYGKTYSNPKFLPDGANVDYIVARPSLDHIVPKSCILEKISSPKFPFDYPIVKIYKCEGINNEYKDFKN